jgi:phytoene desaturase
MSEPLKQPHPGATRAAVIGSGFGGLAAAVRLQSMGIQTTIFEARDKPGGRAYVYEQDGFVFDGGPDDHHRPGLDQGALRRSPAHAWSDYVELIQVESSLPAHLERRRSVRLHRARPRACSLRSAQQYPGDEDGYLRFVDYAKKVFDKGYTELAATPFLRFWDMVRVAPDLARLRADRSVYGTVKRFVKHDHLRQALSFHSLLVGGNPFDTSAIYTLIHYLERNWGVFFPRGGTGALVRALVRLFEELGGETAARQRRSSDRGRDQRAGSRTHLVTTGANQTASPSSTSSSPTPTSTTPTTSSTAGAADAAPMRKKLDGMDWSMSLFVLYFGTDKTYEDEIEHHTIVFGPRYKELLDDIFGGSDLPEDFSLYLHAPTITDPSLAPEGCGSFYVLAPVPHLGHAPLDWDDRARIRGEDPRGARRAAARPPSSTS